jgi:Uroporphyrinogen decarboxylase (URO-D)
MMKVLLQGNPQPRPLVVPVVFALGAKIENLSSRSYLDNPTKISNALRQIRTHLRTDGVSCYFDPYLELEALGARSQWDSANQTRTLIWPEDVQKGELPPNLRSPEEAANSPRVKIAVEVIRRLNSLLRDEPLLLAGVTGPFTLAARLTQLDADEMLRGTEMPEAALEIANATITKIASALVEAGANVIFIREEMLPPLSLDKSEAWTSLLAPVFNIIRFYEALPVLQLATEIDSREDAETILQQQWNAILCTSSLEFGLRAARRTGSSALGYALPLAALQANDSPGESLVEISGMKPVLLTTDGDVPVTTDLKRLMKTFEALSHQM